MDLWDPGGVGTSAHPGVQQAIEAAAASLSVRELTRDFVPLLDEAVGGTASLLFRFGSDGRPSAVGGSLADHLEAYNERLYGRDPLIDALRRARPAQRTIRVEDVLDTRTLARSAAFQEFYRPRGAAHLVGMWPVPMRFGDPGMVGLVIGRPTSDRPFADRERQWLASTLPAFCGAVVRDRRTHALEQEREEMAAALEATSPTCVLDREGQILWASPAAAERLASHPRLVRRLKEAARRLDGEVMDGDVSLCLARDGARVVARLRDPAGPRRKVEARARGLGLSPAEGAVFACVAEGLDNRAIAARLCLSENTVKTHVRQILAKLGAANRTQAALMAHALWPDQRRG